MYVSKYRKELNLIFFLVCYFAFSSLAFAQEATPQIGLGDRFMALLPMLCIVFLIFHLMVLGPQQRKLKAHDALVKTLKKGDLVLTSSGIIGRVAGIEKDYILLEVASNVKVKIQHSHISKLIDKEEKSSEKSAA